MEKLIKLADVMSSLGYEAHTEKTDDWDSCAYGECIIKKGYRTWYVWGMNTGEFEVQMYEKDECVYDGIMRDNLFDVVYVIVTNRFD